MSRVWNKKQEDRKLPRSIYLMEKTWECIDKVGKGSPSAGIHILLEYWQIQHKVEDDIKKV